MEDKIKRNYIKDMHELSPKDCDLYDDGITVSTVGPGVCIKIKLPTAKQIFLKFSVKVLLNHSFSPIRLF
jgi:hypothetical protein